MNVIFAKYIIIYMRCSFIWKVFTGLVQIYANIDLVSIYKLTRIVDEWKCTMWENELPGERERERNKYQLGVVVMVFLGYCISNIVDPLT